MTDSLSIIQRLIHDKMTGRAIDAGGVYSSLNGDVWQLVREATSQDCLIRHTSNSATGVKVSDMSVEKFLAINGSGRDCGALRLLLAKVETVT